MYIPGLVVGVRPNLEHIYCILLLCVLDKPRVDCTLLWSPLKCGGKLRAIDPLGLRPALVYTTSVFQKSLSLVQKDSAEKNIAVATDFHFF